MLATALATALAIALAIVILPERGLCPNRGDPRQATTLTTALTIALAMVILWERGLCPNRGDHTPIEDPRQESASILVLEGLGAGSLSVDTLIEEPGRDPSRTRVLERSRPNS